METMELLSSIPNIDKITNFWMVRAKRGFFFDEFLRDEYIAIGWNAITKSMLGVSLSKKAEDRLRKLISDEYHESKPGTALNKCRRFCYEVKSGDIAIIVDNRRVAFVTIGDYYEDTNPQFSAAYEKEVHSEIESATPNIDHFECPYVKRRRISIIRVLSAVDAVSPYLQSAMARNWHSLSDLNEYAELILSGCFDTFIYNEKLTITFRVAQKKDINVLDLANFVLDSANILSNGHPETVVVKTTLHSPGDIVLQIIHDALDNAVPLLICYVAIFGGKAGNYEFNSLISIIKGFINSKYDKQKRDLELKKLSAEADLVEQEAIGKRLDNITKQRELQLSMADTRVAQLMETSKKLQISPTKSTIIDLDRILKGNTGTDNNLPT